MASGKKRHTWRWVTLAVVALVVIVGAAGVWLAVTGYQARKALLAAADAVAGTQSALLGTDIPGAQAAVAQASNLTAEAAAKTSDPVWTVAGAIPLLGATPKAVTLTTQAADEVVSQALPTFVEAASVLDLETIKDAEGKVDLSRLAPAAEVLGRAQGSLEAADTTLAEVPTTGVVGAVQDGSAELQAKVDEALGISTTASDLLAVAPGLLGQTSPQTYFVAFQSPVEIRGTGGFLGTYGILTVSNGELIEKETESNSNLQRFAEPVVDLGPDYRRLYGQDPALWQNMNMSPNFPYAGVQWATAYQKQFGRQVAGVMAVDINALQYLIQATGPVTAPNGKVLTADNVVSYLGNEIYYEFGEDNAAREQYQADVATELIERVLKLDGGTGKLIEALTTSVSGGHIQMWSPDAAVQETLATTALAGATPSVPGPYVQLVLNNAAANKLDYFMSRTVQYTSGQCRENYRSSTVKVTLLNDVPPEGEGPTYIFGRADDYAEGKPPRSNRTLTYVHLPIDSGVTAIRINGEPAQAFFGAELGHPVAVFALDLPAGEPVTVELDVDEPISAEAPVVPEQPMVRPQETIINWSGC